MAVYKRAYRPYEGPLTSERWRFLVLPRYAFQELFESRLLTGLPGALLRALPGRGGGHLRRATAPAAQALLGRPAGRQPTSCTPEFFLALAHRSRACWPSSSPPGWRRCWSRPTSSTAPCPCYLSRPFSRAEYVLGKAAVLLVLLSAITWVPGLLAVRLQAAWPAGLAGQPTCASAWRHLRRRAGSGSSCSRCWAWRSPPGSAGGWWPAPRSSASSSWAAPSARSGARCCATPGAAW